MDHLSKNLKSNGTRLLYRFIVCKFKDHNIVDTLFLPFAMSMVCSWQFLWWFTAATAAENSCYKMVAWLATAAAAIGNT
jgi:hypothetical protein